jgi:hypothetical protein
LGKVSEIDLVAVSDAFSYGFRLGVQLMAEAFLQPLGENEYMREHYVNEFIAKAKEYIEMPKLMPELLRVFIRKIEVMEKTEKYSRTCGNTIIIHYTFEYPRQCTTIPTNKEKTA